MTPKSSVTFLAELKDGQTPEFLVPVNILPGKPGGIIVISIMTLTTQIEYLFPLLMLLILPTPHFMPVK